ncbi:unnamed protein product [Effrenium voratum]|uniref:Protein kinase domain-containing protein n=1 Tax=Effrenium voratum TaxID=2562239 RepID=A0AA36MWY7_9DINO|nr:unnamed protein product [Effrenium voratum]
MAWFGAWSCLIGEADGDVATVDVVQAPVPSESNPPASPTRSRSVIIETSQDMKQEYEPEETPPESTLSGSRNRTSTMRASLCSISTGDHDSTRSRFSTRSNLEKLRVPLETRGRDSVLTFHTGVNHDFIMGDELGVGGFGSVYLAKSISTSKDVAVKIIPLSNLDSARTADFKEELKVARKLKHPNIVQLHASYETGDNYYLVMEYCMGGTLGQYVLTKNVKKDDIGFLKVGLETHIFAQYAWQMLSGAAYLHYFRVVHRDIKLENYMRISTGEGAQLKLIDFGLACRMKPTREPLCEMVGTVLTMAPEIQSRRYNEKVDIWSIGMVLYMCAVVMDPWYHAEDPAFAQMSEKEILDALKSEDLVIPYYEEYWSVKDLEIRKLVQTLLTVDASDRPSARQVISNDKWLRTLGREDGCCCAIA